MPLFYRVLLILLAIFGLRWLFRRMSAWLQPKNSRGRVHHRQKAGIDNRGSMQRDPVCGAYLDPALAITARRNGEKYYFCSEECHEKFQKENRSP